MAGRTHGDLGERVFSAPGKLPASRSMPSQAGRHRCSTKPSPQREVDRMTRGQLPKRLGFFTRLLDQADAAERYRLATAQIVHAERLGFDSAWVAQHHFHEDEG